MIAIENESIFFIKICHEKLLWLPQSYYFHFKVKTSIIKKEISWSLAWSRGLVKSRQKKWRDSRTRETEAGEKIAVTSTYKPHYHYQNFSQLANGTDLNRQKYTILQSHQH